jgi:hypothetical protein
MSLRPIQFVFFLAITLPAAEVSFNRDIRPIMSDTCFHCHGFDANTREASLRLDIREEAIKKTDEGVLPIVPGNPERSAIIARIFDDADPMPPESAHKPLTAEQKELFRRWVAEGAVYEPHWAYAPLVKPSPPDSTAHPIDAFVQSRLQEKGIQPAPRASAAQLQRRLALDLTGLPPSALPALSGDHAAQVDALLASPHFGERMAVWWLDIARFADTVGFHGDQNQRIFPYRDYVIDAFNSNKPFDLFTREQLAGDLLPDPSPEQLIATGYNRLNMMTREGGAQPKEYLAKYGAERVRSVAAAWFGSTFGCAECHDHKFDPIQTRDFYELQAFFADIKQWGVYANYGYTPEPELEGVNNDSPFPPEIEVESPWMKKNHAAAEKALQQHLKQVRQKLNQDPKAKSAFETWKKQTASFIAAHPSGWQPATISASSILKDGKTDSKRNLILAEDGSFRPDQTLAKGQSLAITLDPAGLPSLASIQLTASLTTLDQDQLIPALGKSLSLTAQIEAADGKRRKLNMRFAEATAKRPIYRGGAEVPGVQSEWRLPKTHPDEQPLRAVWLLETPVNLTKDEKMVITLTGDNLIPMHIAFSPFARLHPLDDLSFKESQPDGSEHFLLATAYDKPAFEEAHRLAAELRQWNRGRTWTMVTQAVAEPLPVRVLPRGNWQDETGPVVLPATPSFLPARLESRAEQRLTRLDLANWITSADNPITARAVMNRLWAAFFGTGLSAVLDDLGSQGELPSHPELLDWLAAEFRDSGWDIKHMIRLIVTSHTYCQSSSLRAELSEIDPANRLLAFQNPRRLEAEFIRDNALAISGLLQLEDIGGPSVKPYQPAGYYEALQFPNRDYQADTDQQQWRRGLYTHWQRTFLHPMLANFDAPARDECAAARTNSNTPQQALTLLNDPTFVEAARVFAARLLQEKMTAAPQDIDQARLTLAYQIALNRPPKAAELTSLLSFLKQQREHFSSAEEAATQLVRTGISPPSDLPPAEHAAWTQVARALLNANEVITRY